MHKTLKAVVFWVVICGSAFMLWQVVKSGSDLARPEEISYSAFLTRVDAGDITRVVIRGMSITATDKNGRSVLVIGPPNPEALASHLKQANVEIWFRDTSQGAGWSAWLLNLAPLLLLAALWYFMIRQIRQTRERKTEGL